MPNSTLYFFVDDDGAVPLEDWLDKLDPKAALKCLAALKRLQLHGFDLRRPEADLLGDRLYELRVRYRTINYRMIYFFSGRNVVVVTHGFSKEKRVPARELSFALLCRSKVEEDFHNYTILGNV